MCSALSQTAAKAMRQNSSTKADAKNCPADQAHALQENSGACLCLQDLQ